MRVEVKNRETVKGGEQIKVKNAVHGRGKTACEEESLIAGKKKITEMLLMVKFLIFLISSIVHRIYRIC